MASKTSPKHVAKRDEHGRLLPGETANPNGRPRKGMALSELARDILDEELPSGVTRKELIMRRAAEAIYAGDWSLLKVFWSYIEGLPRQPIESINNAPIVFSSGIFPDSKYVRPQDDPALKDTKFLERTGEGVKELSASELKPNTLVMPVELGKKYGLLPDDIEKKVEDDTYEGEVEKWK